MNLVENTDLTFFEGNFGNTIRSRKNENNIIKL